MTRLGIIPMHLYFLPGESVRICVPGQSAVSSEPEIVIDGRIFTATQNTLTIALRNLATDGSSLLPRLTSFILCKTTPFGILEFDATGDLRLAEEKPTLHVNLLGTHRSVQRRASFRIELRSEVRYRGLAQDSEWKTAELHDVSLGGASISLPEGKTLEIGRELQIEFTLSNSLFSVSAAVRRIEIRTGSRAHLYALEYLDLSQKQQDQMAKAIVQIQISIINSRVKID